MNGEKTKREQSVSACSHLLSVCRSLHRILLNVSWLTFHLVNLLGRRYWKNVMFPVTTGSLIDSLETDIMHDSIWPSYLCHLIFSKSHFRTFNLQLPEGPLPTWSTQTCLLESVSTQTINQVAYQLSSLSVQLQVYQVCYSVISHSVSFIISKRIKLFIFK